MSFTDEDRRMFVEFIQQVMDKRIMSASRECEKVYAKARKEVQEELGIAALDQEIRDLEGKAVALRKKKEQLGYDKIHNGDRPGSKAQLLLHEKVQSYHQGFGVLADKKANLCGRIWGAQTMEEALEILKELSG